MSDNIEILDEWIVYSNENFKRVKRWLKGSHPSLGTLSYGFTGWETVVETSVLTPTHSFNIVDCPTNPVLLKLNTEEHPETPKPPLHPLDDPQQQKRLQS